jgi:hypothetical protein
MRHPRRQVRTQWKPEDKRAELEACDQGAVQGKRIQVLQKATLPKDLETNERTGESWDKGPCTSIGSTSDGYPKTTSEQS